MAQVRRLFRKAKNSQAAGLTSHHSNVVREGEGDERRNVGAIGSCSPVLGDPVEPRGVVLLKEVPSKAIERHQKKFAAFGFLASRRKKGRRKAGEQEKEGKNTFHVSAGICEESASLP